MDWRRLRAARHLKLGATWLGPASWQVIPLTSAASREVPAHYPEDVWLEVTLVDVAQ